METPERQKLRGEVRELCAQFGDDYWRRCDQERAYPSDFVDTLTEAGYLAALIPVEYGGLGLGIADAAIILEEINRSGGHSAACHAQTYTMGALLKHGSDQQKQAYLPDIARGRLRLQAFSITEPQAGSNTTDITTFATRTDDGYRITGEKNWTSRIDQSDLLILLARNQSPRRRPGQAGRGPEPVSDRPARDPRAAARPAAGRAGPDDVQLRDQLGPLRRDAHPA